MNYVDLPTIQSRYFWSWIVVHLAKVTSHEYSINLGASNR